MTGLYQAAAKCESHPHRARVVLLRLSMMTCAAHLIYMFLDKRALVANLVGLLDQAALQMVLRARAWPAVPLNSTPLLAAAALVVTDQAAWAQLVIPRVLGRAAVAARLPRLAAILAAFVWPVPGGVVLSLAVAADPLPTSAKPPVNSPRAEEGPLSALEGSAATQGAPARAVGALQHRRLAGTGAAGGFTDDVQVGCPDGPAVRGGGGGGGGGGAAWPGRGRQGPTTQGRVLRLLRRLGSKVGLHLEPEGLPVADHELRRDRRIAYN